MGILRQPKRVLLLVRNTLDLKIVFLLLQKQLSKTGFCHFVVIALNLNVTSKLKTFSSYTNRFL